MENKKYLIARLQHNEINLISCGHSSVEINEKLQDSLRLLFISAEMFNDFKSPNDPSYFLQLAHDSLEKAKVEDRLKVFDLSGMSEIFESRKKISELSSENTSTDTLRHWACLWQIGNTTTAGLLGEVPTFEELRWLVTDTGFYITKLNPCPKSPKSIDEKEHLIRELIAHFDVALKFGAPKKTLLLLAEIINELSTKFTESKGDFSHLTLDELVNKLNSRRALERMNERSETKFWVAGPSSDELEKLISIRKNNLNNEDISTSNFRFSSELLHFISVVKNSK